MSTYATAVEPLPEVEPAYRPLSALAAAALVFGLLSFLALFAWVLALIPVLGLLVAGLAVVELRRSDHLTGEPLAWVGLVLSGLFLVSGLSWQAYAYATEVPAGYERLTFQELQTPDDAPHLPPPDVAARDGSQVFVKGYIRPGSYTTNLKRFYLVKDDGSCCYGPNLPKPGDMIEVNLLGNLALDYSPRLQKVGGRLRIAWQPIAGQGTGILYHLDVDYLP